MREGLWYNLGTRGVFRAPASLILFQYGYQLEQLDVV
jgi:hypothetical protein